MDRPCVIVITPKLFYTNENGTEEEYGCSQSFVKIRVVKSALISLAAAAFGLASFSLLICSFYPQIGWSFVYADTAGVSEDYLMLSAFGFVSSTIFDFAFCFSEKLRIEFFRNHRLEQYPAQLNDVIFSGHQVFAVTVLIAQSLFYRTIQPLSACGLALLVSNLAPSIVLIFFVALKKLLLIDYLYFANFVRFMALSLRYLPQITYNLDRGSASGFSPIYLCLDFLGSLLAVLQVAAMIFNLSKLKSFRRID